jgi:large subunit ribosomal protein L6
MSRIAKKVISLTQDIKIIDNENHIIISKDNNYLLVRKQKDIDYNIENGVISINYKKENSSLAGLFRSQLSNAVLGLQKPYIKKIMLNGLGYRVSLEKDNQLSLQVGCSHKINIQISIKIRIELIKDSELLLSSYDKDLLGQETARILAIKKPDCYHAKGIFIKDQYIERKSGKNK